MLFQACSSPNDRPPWRWVLESCPFHRGVNTKALSRSHTREQWGWGSHSGSRTPEPHTHPCCFGYHTPLSPEAPATFPGPQPEHSFPFKCLSSSSSLALSTPLKRWMIYPQKKERDGSVPQDGTDHRRGRPCQAERARRGLNTSQPGRRTGEISRNRGEGKPHPGRTPA